MASPTTTDPAMHTPGPWRVEYEADGALTVIYGGDDPVANICPIVSDEANAALIAAAPALLAAACAAHAGNIAMRQTGEEYVMIPRAAYDALAAAIAAAERAS